MKIKSFTIRNFKSFDSNPNEVLDEVRGISDCNMLYGYNNCGKSNVLKFLKLIFEPKINQERVTVEGEYQTIVRRTESPFWKGLIDDSGYMFHKNARQKLIEFKFVINLEHNELTNLECYTDLQKEFLSTNNQQCTLRFSGSIKAVDDFHTSEIILVDADLNARSIYKTNQTGSPSYFDGHKGKTSNLKGNAAAFSELFSLLNGATHYLDNGRFIGSEKIDPLAKELSPSKFKNWLYNLYFDPQDYTKYAALSKFIRENSIATSNADEATFKSAENNSPLVQFDAQFSRSQKENIEIMLTVGQHRLPISSFGSGVQQLMLILANIFIIKPKILLIEELEMSFSPTYQKKLLHLLRKLLDAGVIDQVFFTTHSSHMTYRNDFSIYEVALIDGVSRISKVASKRKLFFNPII